MVTMDVQPADVERVLSLIRGEKLVHVEQNARTIREIADKRREAVLLALMHSPIPPTGSPAEMARIIDEYNRQERVHETRFKND